MGVIKRNPNHRFQSPHLILQAAGSTGSDGSTAGIHLRWTFNGALGRNHLPKGNNASNYYNYNTPEDFVRIYKGKYARASLYFDLRKAPQHVIDAQGHIPLWVYEVHSPFVGEPKHFHVKFMNENIYHYIRYVQNINPMTDPENFIQAYGSNLIEIKSANDLFFAVTCGVTYDSQSYNPRVETETLTETQTYNENKDGKEWVWATHRYVSSRKTYEDWMLNHVRLVCENGRSIRYRAYQCQVLSFEIELYSDLLEHINRNNGWEILGDYALSLEFWEVDHRLNPLHNLHLWPRYNHPDYASPAIYKDRWTGMGGNSDRNIEDVVKQYIRLSDDPDNPSGIEWYPGDKDDDAVGMPLVDILNAGAMDFHVARMLGLGVIDPDVANSGYDYYDSCVYVAEYFSVGDLDEKDLYGNPFPVDKVQHLFMSLPTLAQDERLPLPVEIAEIIPGIANKPDSDKVSLLTDSEGYTFDGLSRYVTLIAKPEPENKAEAPFYASHIEFSLAESSLPVYAGVEYIKPGDTDWLHPELSSELYPDYGIPQTIPLMVSEDTRVIYIHRQDESGLHQYCSYGINLFARTSRSPDIHSIKTDLQPANLLKPPANIKAHLIRKESPLLLTSQEEQGRYAHISGDKTLVRLTFDYNIADEHFIYKIGDKYHNLSDMDIVHNIAGNTYPEEKEIYAENFEVYFRNSPPAYTQGKAIAVQDSAQNPMISEIMVRNYTVGSTGEVLVPELTGKYVGGMLVIGDQRFIVHSILANNRICVLKNVPEVNFVSGDPQVGASASTFEEGWEIPLLTEDGLFMMIENMQRIGNWDPNKQPVRTIHIDLQPVNREIFYKTTADKVDDNGNMEGNVVTERYLDKARGFWNVATIEPVRENAGKTYPDGYYKLTFKHFALPAHSQYHPQDFSVEYYKGIVRLKREKAYSQQNYNGQTNNDGYGERSAFEVVDMGTTSNGNLVLYISDSDFDSGNPIRSGSQLVNYQPGYKSYLYQNGRNLSEFNILPTPEDGIKYSIATLRSSGVKNNESHYSRFGTPGLMFAQYLEAPQQPQRPTGNSSYATRPDSFGKSSYTFTSRFNHKPNAILFGRSSDGALLKILYSETTVEEIRLGLASLSDAGYAQSWDTFFDIENLRGLGTYPAVEDGYQFPLPNGKLFLNIINAFIDDYNKQNGTEILHITGYSSFGTKVLEISIIDFIEQIVESSFVPLTEFPVVYQHIRSGNYYPQNKKQNIKDRNGYLLPPTSEDFEMAPMAKILNPDSSNPEVLFCDFTLDGTSDDVYFYRVREIDSQMKMGKFSSFLGPVKLVNTNPPEAPEIKSVMPVLENKILHIAPSIKFEINAYHPLQKIRKIILYRADNKLDAQSVHSMDRVKEILLTDEMMNREVWAFEDDFDDLTDVPYGTALYYRITVAREVEYPEGNTIVTEYAPSKPSKMLGTLIVESYAPESPVLEYHFASLVDSQLLNTVLEWNKTISNGKYHVYQMNSQRNWRQIAEVLAGTLSLALDPLDILDAENNTIYNHFKVIAENSSGMFSAEENILTIPQS